MVWGRILRSFSTALNAIGQKGATASEYSLCTAIMVVGVVSAVGTVGENANDALGSATLQGGSTIQITAPPPGRDNTDVPSGQGNEEDAHP